MYGTHEPDSSAAVDCCGSLMCPSWWKPGGLGTTACPRTGEVSQLNLEEAVFGRLLLPKNLVTFLTE